jgi:hypothetical protein
VPNNACSIRVHTQVNYVSFFAGILGYPTQTGNTRATARIAPTNPPTQFTGVWPIVHWTYNDLGCTYQLGTLCTFWDSSAPPGGSFKATIDMSRYSDIFGSPRVQHWVDYDHRWPGNTGQIPDLEQWLRHGWQGTVFVDEFDSRCQTANLACPNNKFEAYNGNNGNNLVDMMRAYINDPAHLEGTDPTLGNFATINIFFWRYGEQNIDPATNVGTIWGGTANPTTENRNYIQRVILQKVRGFRFYASNASIPSNSTVKGYYVSLFVTNGTPQNGPPSPASRVT